MTLDEAVAYALEGSGPADSEVDPHGEVAR